MALADPLAIADFYDLFKVQDVQFVQGFQQQRSATGGGETRYADRAPSLWKAEITTIPMLNAEAEGIMALVNSRGGGLKTVLMYNSRLPYPASDPTGSWLSSGSDLPVGETSLICDFAGDDYAVEGRPALISQVVSCTRASPGLAMGSDGTWQEFGVDQPRITDLGLMVEPASANAIRNNTNQGQLGTGLPTNWSHALVGGLSVECAAGTEDGLPYTDIRIFGTASVAQSFVAFESNSGIPAALGQTWTFSAFARLIAAPNPPTAYNLRTREHNGAAVLSNLNQPFVPTGAKQRVVQTLTLASDGVSSIRPGFAIAVTMGQAVDFTLRVSGAQDEQDSSPSTPILTTGAAATRAADAVTLDLPAGTQDLTFTFDDESTRVIAGQSGSYVIPTDLDRRIIKSVVAVKTSTVPTSPASPKLGAITDRLHIAFIGFPPGYVIPRGTYFSIVFDTSRYYLGQFAEPRTASGAGAVASVEIWPPLPASISGTPDVVIIKPPGKFRIEPGSAYPAKEGGLHSVIKFSAEQTYSK